MPKPHLPLCVKGENISFTGKLIINGCHARWIRLQIERKTAILKLSQGERAISEGVERQLRNVHDGKADG